MLNHSLLLQTTIIQTADETTMYITGGIIAVFVVFLIIGANANKSGSSSSGIGGSTSKPASNRASRKKFRKHAKKTRTHPRFRLNCLKIFQKRYKVPLSSSFFYKSQNI